MNWLVVAGLAGVLAVNLLVVYAVVKRGESKPVTVTALAIIWIAGSLLGLLAAAPVAYVSREWTLIFHVLAAAPLAGVLALGIGWLWHLARSQ